MTNEERSHIMTANEVADYLRIHKSTVYRMAKQRQMPGTRIGNQWRFRRDAIDRWLSAKEEQ